MLDNLDALVALAEEGTVTRAATRLRITQSAVSKRLAALGARVGHAVVEPTGRRVRLTRAGRRLVETAAPALAALRGALAGESEEPSGRLVVGVSESILASWGPPLLAQVLDDLPGLALELNAHRSPVAIDRVRSGEYALALVAGESDAAPDLAVEPLLEEEMVIVPAGLDPAAAALPGDVPVLTIEPASATWRSLRRRTGHLSRKAGITLEVTRTVQSFSAVVQMARHGFGHGLVPLGIARALGTPENALVRLPAPGLTRPVSLVGRRTTFGRALPARFREALAERAREGLVAGF